MIHISDLIGLEQANFFFFNLKLLYTSYTYHLQMRKCFAGISLLSPALRLICPDLLTCNTSKCWVSKSYLATGALFLNASQG